MKEGIFLGNHFDQEFLKDWVVQQFLINPIKTFKILLQLIVVDTANLMI